MPVKHIHYSIICWHSLYCLNFNNEMENASIEKSENKVNYNNEHT